MVYTAYTMFKNKPIILTFIIRDCGLASCSHPNELICRLEAKLYLLQILNNTPGKPPGSVTSHKNHFKYILLHCIVNSGYLHGGGYVFGVLRLFDLKQDCTKPTSMGQGRSHYILEQIWLTGQFAKFSVSFTLSMLQDFWTWQKSVLNNSIHLKIQ